MWNACDRMTAIKVTIDGCTRNETPFDPRLDCNSCEHLGYIGSPQAGIPSTRSTKYALYAA